MLAGMLLSVWDAGGSNFADLFYPFPTIRPIAKASEIDLVQPRMGKLQVKSWLDNPSPPPPSHQDFTFPHYDEIQ